MGSLITRNSKASGCSVSVSLFTAMSSPKLVYPDLLVCPTKYGVLCTYESMVSGHSRCNNIFEVLLDGIGTNSQDAEGNDPQKLP